MWELQDSPEGSVHCQFGLFLCRGPMELLKVTYQCMSLMSLSASLLNKPSHLEWAEISRGDLSPANRIPFLNRLCQICSLQRKAVGKLQEQSGHQEGFRLQQAACFHSKCPCMWVEEGDRKWELYLGQYVRLGRDLGQIFYHMDLTILCQVVLVLKSADVSQSTPLSQGPRSLPSVGHKESIAVENLVSCI